MKSFEECSQREKVARWLNVLRVLRALTPHQRRKHWNMAIFGEQTECGTVACAAGHCEADPWFRRRGFKGKYVVASGDTILVSRTIHDIDVGSWFDADWFGYDVREFFGMTGANAIFMNDNLRPVGQVIREVRAHIKSLVAS